jgi:hypothetical protein
MRRGDSSPIHKEVIPAVSVDEEQETDDDIVPGPLDEEDEGIDEDEDETVSDSVPGDDEPPDVEYRDPDAPAKLPVRDPLIVDE